MLCIALGGIVAAAITFVFDTYFGLQSKIIFVLAIVFCCYYAMLLASAIMEKIARIFFGLN
jgi:hypothetical protein